MGRILRNTACAVLALGAVAVPATAAHAGGCVWTAEALPLPAGASSGRVEASDHQGGLVGSIVVAGQRRLAYWVDGKAFDLGVQGGGEFTIIDGNRAGAVLVDTLGPDPYVSRAFRIQNGKKLELPKPVNTFSAAALGGNDRGDVIGHLIVGDFNGPVLWPGDQPDTVVPYFGLPDGAEIRDIDKDGTVLYGYVDADNTHQSYVQRDGVARGLPPTTKGAETFALHIDNGLVIGTEVPPGGQPQAAIWDTRTTRIPPPVLLPQGRAALAVNASGTVAGETSPTALGNPEQAATWANAQLTKLPRLVTGAPSSATTIEDDGTVAGSASNGQTTVPARWHCA